MMRIDRTLRLSLSCAVSSLLFAVACSDASDSDSRGEDGGGAGEVPCKERYPASQVASASCCKEWGPDACGAGLFCEAFDGREITTCYAERSRTNLAECSADVQCASNSCNVEQRKCRGMYGEACDPAVGCPRDVDGDVLTCTDKYDGFSCDPG